MISDAARAALERADGYAASGHFEEAVAAFEEALKGIDPRADAESRQAFVRAHVDAGVAHGNANRSREELAHYEIALGETAGEASLDSLALRAMANSVTPLHELGRMRDAIARCEEIAARFSGRGEFAGTVAEAAVQKGVLQREAGLPEEAERTLMAVLASNAAAMDPANWAFGVMTLGELLAARGEEEGAVRSGGTLVRA
ncbi:MAG TPA: hypothetical protein VMV18_13345, partial [bacterium]|nr:hypothetical protein [bacterium]